MKFYLVVYYTEGCPSERCQPFSSKAEAIKRVKELQRLNDDFYAPKMKEVHLTPTKENIFTLINEMFSENALSDVSYFKSTQLSNR